MDSGSVEKLLNDPEEVQAYLRDKGWLPCAQSVKVEALSGGVSSRVWKIISGSERWVMKQALPKLNVQAEWYSDVSRIVREQVAMQSLYALLPRGTVPEVLHTDHENYTYIMTCAPEDAVTWKSLLMAGHFETNVAGRMGYLLGIMHRKSMDWGEAEKAEFRDLRYFVQLRIDPFHLYLIECYPELKPQIEHLIHQLTQEQSCLVHGDFSPKNMLVDPSSQVILIDFEVAHWGHPVFDLAFCTAHLMLKGWALQRKADASLLIQAFYKEYGTCYQELLPHLGLMLLARLDGKSPIEYISDVALREEIRKLAILWIKQGSAVEPLQAIDTALKGEESH